MICLGEFAQGVTLIEMLIVVAILSLMVVGVGNTFFYVFQEQAFVSEQLGVQQSANLAMESVAVDAWRATSVKTPGEGQIIFIVPSGVSPSREVKYMLKDRRLIRLSGGEKGRARQILAEDVKAFSARRVGKLLRVRIRLEKQRYRRKFSADYSTAFMVEGVR